MEPSQKADVFMRIFNADGSEVDACGNAARCIALIAAEETGRSEVSVETNAGLLKANVNGADRITIDMGKPRFAWDEIPLAEPFHDTTGIERNRSRARIEHDKIVPEAIHFAKGDAGSVCHQSIYGPGN